MNPKTSNTDIKQYINEFPNWRDFFLLDFEENIQNFKTTNNKDPEYIFVTAENKEKKIHENIFRRKDFLSDYEIIKVLTQNKYENRNYINFIIPKKIFINAREIRLLVEIKKRPSLMEEIKRKTKVNLDTKDNIIFKEIFLVPVEEKFYNRIFTLHILKKDSNQIPNYKNQINNNSFNIMEAIQIKHNDNINNNASNNNNNNYNYIGPSNLNNNVIPNIEKFGNVNANIYKNKKDLKGHTGFF